MHVRDGEQVAAGALLVELEPQRRENDMMDKAILTCALTGVLTDPKQHPVPVTPAQMAAEARDAFNAGAASCTCTCAARKTGWAICRAGTRTWPRPWSSAIREACPGVIINLTTGVIGKDIAGPLACIRRVGPRSPPATPAA